MKPDSNISGTEEAQAANAARQFMGTPEAAKAALLERAREWREYRQPSIATAKEHRRIDTLERESRFQLANAALLWLWHEENPQEPAMPQDVEEIVEKLKPAHGTCPFCQRDPYHYVDNGVGMEAVAVTCCERGIALFQYGDEELRADVALREQAASLILSQSAALASAREVIEQVAEGSIDASATAIIIGWPTARTVLDAAREWKGR